MLDDVGLDAVLVLVVVVVVELPPLPLLSIERPSELTRSVINSSPIDFKVSKSVT